MLNRAARIIRAESPGDIILIGGLSDIWGAGFLDKLLDLTGSLDIRGSFDIVSYHAYSAHQLKIDLIRSVLAEHGLQSRPLWNTELNYMGWDYTQAAAGLDDLYQLMLANNTTRTFWFYSQTSRWGPGIFEPLPQPFVPSPFYQTFKTQAMPIRVPGEPVVLSPGEISRKQHPYFQWQAPAAGSYPLAGYKLQIDATTFLDAPRFARPELDAWLTLSKLNFLPLAVGGRQGAAAFSSQIASVFPSSAFEYIPEAPLAWGLHYWRVAALDAEGNIGTYTQPQVLLLRPPISRYFPLLD
jgi:hypothetical protein